MSDEQIRETVVPQTLPEVDYRLQRRFTHANWRLESFDISLFGSSVYVTYAEQGPSKHQPAGGHGYGSGGVRRRTAGG